MTKINSRSKGKRGELAWAKVLTFMGFPARRGQQFAGTPDSPDVVCPSLPDIHWEVKNVERLNIYDAWDKACVDAGLTKTPMLAMKKNNYPWLVVMSPETLAQLLRESDFVV